VHEILSEPNGPDWLWARARSAVLRGVTRWSILPLGYEPSIGEMFVGTDVHWLDGDRERMRKYFEAIWNHEFRKMPIDVILFRVALDPFEGPHEPGLGWQRVTRGTITIEYLAGIHDRVLRPEGSRDLAPRLEAYLKRRSL
jgi:hypothetical protein